MDEKEIASKLNGCAAGDVLAVRLLEDGGLVSVVRTGHKRWFTAEQVAAVLPASPAVPTETAGPAAAEPATRKGKGRKK